MVGKWSGTLHQPGGDPAYYPMKITLRAGHPPDEIGESWYSKQNCHGTLTLGDANQYGFMLTEDIQEPRGVCSKTPMHFTVRVTRGDELEVKYWWSANINAASIWYADATLQRLR